MIRTETTSGVIVYRHGNDINGNPRYFVHYLELGLTDHISTEATRAAGLRIFHGRAFGGGYTFTSYGIDESVKGIMRTLARYGISNLA